MLKKVAFMLLLSLTLAFSFAYAEDVKGYSSCNVCPGSVYYEPHEARTILGRAGLESITRLKEGDKVNIDLSTVLTSTSPKDADRRWTVKLRGNERILYIQDSLDESYIQIVTDYLRARQEKSVQTWHPELYIQSGKSDTIERDDSIDQAWEKLERSNIYRWVMDGHGAVAWDVALGVRLSQVLKVARPAN